MMEEMKNLKVALAHDWLTGFRGGERVLEALTEIFPQASLYTLLHQKGSVPASIAARPIQTSFLDKVPGIYQNYRKFLPLFPGAVDRMRIEESNLDLILSSSHCVIKGLRTAGTRRVKHISYIHSPMRYLYDQYDVYFGPNSPVLQRWGMKLFRNYLQKWDERSNLGVDVMVANSSFVRERIRTFYGRESVVIHPFVELADFLEIQNHPVGKEDFYLMVTAFAPNKRVDLAIKALQKLGRRLRIVGSGQLEGELKNLSRGREGQTTELLGNLPRGEVVKLLGKARALIFPGVEDFGIVPLEALAAGTPVIAYRAGGVLETLSEETAEFFASDHEDSLGEAILRFEKKNFSRERLIARAREFSKEHFKKAMINIISETLRK